MIDHRSKGVISFLCAESDALEVLEFAKETFNEVTAFVEFPVDYQGQAALWPLRDDDLCASGVQLCDDPVGSEGLVGNQSLELNACPYRKSNLTRKWADIGRCFAAWSTFSD